MRLTGIAVRLGILALLLFEGLSPLVIRSQLDGNASRAAFEAVLEYERSNSIDQAKATAVREADQVGAVILADDPATPADPKTRKGDEGFWRDDDGTIHVVMEKTAPSLIFIRFSQTKSWYHVRVEAKSKRGRV